jgi:hypothetical protein
MSDNQDVRITTTEAARVLGMNASTISTWIVRGKLDSVLENGRNYVSLREVAALNAKKGTPFGTTNAHSTPKTPTPNSVKNTETPLSVQERLSLLEWAIAYGTPADLTTIREGIQARQRNKLKSYQ